MRESSSSFVPTRWTIVAQARGDDAQAQEALSELCDAYYEPVIFFLQREGRSVDSAQELAHDFFAKLCLLYTSPSPRDLSTSRMPSSA